MGLAREVSDMKLKIDEYVIESDGMCITLKIPKPFTAGGKNKDKIIGHYPNMTQGLLRLLEEHVSDSAVTEAKALVKVVNDFKERVSTPELLKAVMAGAEYAG